MTDTKGSGPSELLVSDSQPADTPDSKNSKTSGGGTPPKKSKSPSTRAAPAKKNATENSAESAKKTGSRKTNAPQKPAETSVAESESVQPPKASRSRKREDAPAKSSPKQSSAGRAARSKTPGKAILPSDPPVSSHSEKPDFSLSGDNSLPQDASQQWGGSAEALPIQTKTSGPGAEIGGKEEEAPSVSTGAGGGKESPLKIPAAKSGSSPKKTAAKPVRTSRKKTQEPAPAADTLTPMPEARREHEESRAAGSNDRADTGQRITSSVEDADGAAVSQEKTKPAKERKQAATATGRAAGRKKTAANDGATEKTAGRSRRTTQKNVEPDISQTDTAAIPAGKMISHEEPVAVDSSSYTPSQADPAAGMEQSASLENKTEGERKNRSHRTANTTKSRGGRKGAEARQSERGSDVEGYIAPQRGGLPEEGSSASLEGEDTLRRQEPALVSIPQADTAPRKDFEKQTRAENAGEDSSATSWTEFPSGFFDSSPEDFFDSLDSDDEEGEDASVSDGGIPEKKRRSRGRRGRGRKKAAAQQAAESDTAGTQEVVSPVEEEKEDTDDDFVVVEEFDDDDEPGLLPSRGKGRQEDKDSEESSAVRNSRRKMFVSVLPEEQVEVVLTEEGQVLEYYVEMLQQAKTKGNIYKGIIHNVDPNLQAAFVSYGAVKNGFLQIDEVHPEYYVTAYEADKGRKYPPIQKVLKAGQEVLVQVVKEPAGTKGAFLTTYLSMPGRFLVLTPGREQIGVSRKVENEKERARLRELLEGLSPGPGLGVIVRTVSMGASKTNLQRDLQYLKRTWKEVRTRGTTEKAPCLVYQEKDLTSRAVRDYLTENVGEIWVDDEQTAGEVTDIAEALFPRKNNFVRVHKDTGTSLFERFNLQRQLDQIHSREVSLPSGGRLVIDATEALTAIDINSGRSGGKSNFEDMAFRTNMEAAKMIPLQLRLRDIGGQIVADFIEMRDKNHWREVEKTLRNGMKVDRARYDVGKIGPFGMMEIVRQRLGSSAISVSTEPCPCCNGTGTRRNMEWQSQNALREILRSMRAAQAQKQEKVFYKTEADLVLHLLNHKRQRLQEMEQSYGVQLEIQIGIQDKP